MQEACHGVSLNVDTGRQCGVVVNGGGTVQPCSVHMADEEGLEVGFHQLTGLSDQWRVDDLDASNGGVGHRGVTGPAALLRQSSH